MIDKYSYITVLANDTYLKGVLVLNESLKKVNSKYKLRVLVGKNVTQKAKDILMKHFIDIIIPNNEIVLPDLVIKQNHAKDFDYWTNSFLKLLIFDLIDFEKIVFLDCDVLVIHNIDDLFDKPHMSGTQIYKYTDNSPVLSSGLLVIKPEKDFSLNFKPFVDNLVQLNTQCGDEAVLKEYYPNWENDDALHLDIGNHMVFGSVWFHYKNFGYGKKDKPIKVVHFPGKKKPWMYPLNHIEHYFKFILRQQWILFKIFLQYDLILCKVNFNLLFK